MSAPAYPERSNFARVKESVNLAEYASRHTTLDHTGRGKCPICQKGGAQAFAVYPDKGHWHCYHGCGGGSVLDLHSALYGGCEVWASALALAEEYGVELKEGRTEGWRRAQAIKYCAVSEIEAAIDERRQERLFDILCAPYVAECPTDTEEQMARSRKDADELWGTCLLVAREMRHRRSQAHPKVGGGR